MIRLSPLASCTGAAVAGDVQAKFCTPSVHAPSMNIPTRISGPVPQRLRYLVAPDVLRMTRRTESPSAEAPVAVADNATPSAGSAGVTDGSVFASVVARHAASAIVVVTLTNALFTRGLPDDIKMNESPVIYPIGGSWFPVCVPLPAREAC